MVRGLVGIQRAWLLPVGAPVPEVPQMLSKGVIDGTVVPWEVTTPLKVAELVDSHTYFAGTRGLYTSFFVFAMNKAKYDALPGLALPLPAHAFPTGRQMGDYLESYARHHELPVRTGVRVDGLRASGDGGGGYVVSAGTREYRADQVIVASEGASVLARRLVDLCVDIDVRVQVEIGFRGTMPHQAGDRAANQRFDDEVIEARRDDRDPGVTHDEITLGRAFEGRRSV